MAGRLLHYRSCARHGAANTGERQASFRRAHSVTLRRRTTPSADAPSLPGNANLASDTAPATPHDHRSNSRRPGGPIFSASAPSHDCRRNTRGGTQDATGGVRTSSGSAVPPLRRGSARDSDPARRFRTLVQAHRHQPLGDRRPATAHSIRRLASLGAANTGRRQAPFRRPLSVNPRRRKTRRRAKALRRTSERRREIRYRHRQRQQAQRRPAATSIASAAATPANAETHAGGAPFPASGKSSAPPAESPHRHWPAQQQQTRMHSRPHRARTVTETARSLQTIASNSPRRLDKTQPDARHASFCRSHHSSAHSLRSA